MINDADLLARLIASARDGVSDIDAANEAEGRTIAEKSSTLKYMPVALSYLILKKRVAGTKIKTATPVIARRHNIDEAIVYRICSGGYDGATKAAIEFEKTLSESDIAEELARLDETSSRREERSSRREEQ